MSVPTSFEWDDAKAERNVGKHGLSFVEATAVFLDSGGVVTNTTREEDGEDRQKVIGRIGNHLFAVVFVVRGGAYRLISARRANANEERVYDNR